MAFNFSGFGEAGQRWLVQVKPDPLDGGTMRGAQIEELVSAWLEFQHTPEDAPEWAARRSIVDRFDDLYTSDPERARAAILRVIELESDDDVLGVLAAAPLEDLLSRPGGAFIERVEERARADRRFLRVLRDVWQLSITDEVWRRVKAARGEPAV